MDGAVTGSERTGAILAMIYNGIALLTFVYLTFFDGYDYTWWNWIVAIPVNAMVSAMWPIYWGILRWFF